VALLAPLESLESLESLELTPSAHINQPILSGVPRLYEKIILNASDEKMNAILAPFLENIYICDDLDNALRIQTQIIQNKMQASVVTPEGIWLGRGWVRLNKGAIEHNSGLLQREAELRTIEEQLMDSIAALEMKQLQLKEVENAFIDCEAARKLLQINRNQAHRRLSEATAQLQSARTQLAHKNDRLTQIQIEQQEIQSANQKAQTAIMAARQIIEQTIEQFTVQTDLKTAFESNRNVMIQSIQEEKKIAMQRKDEAHALALALQKAQTQWSSMKNNKERALEQVEILEDKIETIAQTIEDNIAPIVALEDKLHEVVDHHPDGFDGLQKTLHIFNKMVIIQ